MSSDDDLAQWAALFMCSYSDTQAAPVPADVAKAINYVGLTPSAIDLLQSVDAGGVPAFVTANLIQIALDNGVEITGQHSPNEIIDLIRAKAVVSAIY
jgi:hypothetical protein